MAGTWPTGQLVVAVALRSQSLLKPALDICWPLPSPSRILHHRRGFRPSASSMTMKQDQRWGWRRRCPFRRRASTHSRDQAKCPGRDCGLRLGLTEERSSLRSRPQSKRRGYYRSLWRNLMQLAFRHPGTSPVWEIDPTRWTWSSSCSSSLRLDRRSSGVLSIRQWRPTAGRAPNHHGPPPRCDKRRRFP